MWKRFQTSIQSVVHWAKIIWQSLIAVRDALQWWRWLSGDSCVGEIRCQHWVRRWPSSLGGTWKVEGDMRDGVRRVERQWENSSHLRWKLLTLRIGRLLQWFVLLFPKTIVSIFPVWRWQVAKRMRSRDFSCDGTHRAFFPPYNPWVNIFSWTFFLNSIAKSR